MTFTQQQPKGEKKQCCGECEHMVNQTRSIPIGICFAPVPQWVTVDRANSVAAVQDKDGSNCPAFRRKNISVPIIIDEHAFTPRKG